MVGHPPQHRLPLRPEEAGVRGSPWLPYSLLAEAGVEPAVLYFRLPASSANAPSIAGRVYLGSRYLSEQYSKNKVRSRRPITSCYAGMAQGGFSHYSRSCRDPMYVKVSGPE